MILPERRSPAVVAIVYVLFGCLWILLSDYVIAKLEHDRWSLAILETYNAWAFIGITGLLIFVERRQADTRTANLTRIVECSDDAVLGVALDDAITMWNLGAQRLFGYAFGEIRGRPVSLLWPEGAAEHMAAVLARAKRGEVVRHCEGTRISKSGETILVSLNFSPVRDTRGRIAGISIIARDVTERRRAEQSARMAEIGRLASGLVHEIRNPLNAMRMQLALVRRKLGSSADSGAEAARDQLGRLENEVLRLQKLATDLLAYGRPAPENPEEINVCQLIAEVAEFIRPEFEGIDARIRVESAAKSTDAVVVMDRGKLRQVLLNLAQNGRQAMGEQGELVLGCEEPTEQEVRIRVSDTGCGIPSDKLSTVFEAFYSTKDRGTGLGLAIAKQALEKAGGRITVQSEVGVGTTFEICLPRAPRSDASSSGGTVHDVAV